MQIPIEISFQGMDPSDFVRDRIESEAGKLERFHDRITHCRVVVVSPGHHHGKGGLYGVHVHLTVPGHQEIVVSREPQKNKARQDPYVAVRDAFNAARRQLQDVERRLDETKPVPHNVEQFGTVAQLIAEEDYGFIDAPGMTDVYFHKNDVTPGDFEKLLVGTGVRFITEEGADGPKASLVRIAHEEAGG